MRSNFLNSGWLKVAVLGLLTVGGIGLAEQLCFPV